MAIGLDNEYKKSTLINIVTAGNAKKSLLFFNVRPDESGIIKIGSEKISLIIECRDPNEL